jgi:hypothetical protein
MTKDMRTVFQNFFHLRARDVKNQQDVYHKISGPLQTLTSSSHQSKKAIRKDSSWVMFQHSSEEKIGRIMFFFYHAEEMYAMIEIHGFDKKNFWVDDLHRKYIERQLLNYLIISILDIKAPMISLDLGDILEQKPVAEGRAYEYEKESARC